jgi:hypothetical protein
MAERQANWIARSRSSIERARQDGGGFRRGQLRPVAMFIIYTGVEMATSRRVGISERRLHSSA